MVAARNEFIARVDTALLHQVRWPFLRVLVPGYVEHAELTHYLNRLLATGNWVSVRAVPHPVEGKRTDGAPHEFDIYGNPAVPWSLNRRWQPFTR